MALVLALAVAACCILTASWPKVEARVRANPAARKALTAAAALVVVVVLGGILVRVGSPVHLVSEGLGPLQQPPPPSHRRNLNNRLASVSLNGRGRFWDAAWSDFTSHPVAGSGAGTFKRYWLQHRTVDANISDAHSFLLQTGAELGLVGVVLLLIVVGAALVAAFRAWRHPAVPALAAVFAAFLVHAASDRDWEVPAVACFALCVAAALVRLASGGDWIVIRGGARRALMIALAVVVAVGAWEFAGNLAMSRARVNLDHRSYGAARWKAEGATWLAPWAARGRCCRDASPLPRRIRARRRPTSPGRRLATAECGTRGGSLPSARAHRQAVLPPSRALDGSIRWTWLRSAARPADRCLTAPVPAYWSGR